MHAWPLYPVKIFMAQFSRGKSFVDPDFFARKSRSLKLQIQKFFPTNNTHDFISFQKQKKFGTDNFSQEIPGYVSQSDYRSGPPILPPHLNQVILNKVSRMGL